MARSIMVALQFGNVRGSVTVVDDDPMPESLHAEIRTVVESCRDALVEGAGDDGPVIEVVFPEDDEDHLRN